MAVLINRSEEMFRVLPTDPPVSLVSLVPKNQGTVSVYHGIVVEHLLCQLCGYMQIVCTQ